MPPDLSVCIITRNQEDYILAALAGALMQRTTFEYEVVVGDDCSDDATPQLCAQVASTSSVPIRYARADVRVGMMRNFLDTVGRCSGRYIAICEGDDYWTDAHKLQAQHDLLEAHPDASASFHNALIETTDGNRQVWHRSLPAGAYGVQDLFKRWLVPTASLTYRRPDGRYPSYLDTATHGDLGLLVYLADRGPLLYNPTPMSVYRRHPGGVMNSFAGIDFQNRQIAFLADMDRWFDLKYHQPIGRRISRLRRSNALLLASAGKRRQAIMAFKRALAESDPYDGSIPGDLLRLLFRSLWPPKAGAPPSD